MTKQAVCRGCKRWAVLSVHLWPGHCYECARGVPANVSLPARALPDWDDPEIPARAPGPEQLDLLG